MLTYGEYGGRFVPETLIPALDELEAGWRDAREDPSHAVEGLDGNHVRVPAREDARQLPGSGTEIEHGRVGRDRQEVEHLVGIRRACRLVLLGGEIEAARGVDHGPECIQIFCRHLFGRTAPV